MNRVSTIMATKGNGSPLAINKKVNELAVGQIGVFNAETNLSLSVASPVSNAKNFYIAVGVDTTGGSTTNDIVKSSGNYINMNEITNISFRCYSPHQGEIIDVINFVANCQTQYSVNIKLNVAAARVTYGFNLPGKTYNYVTSCCNDCGSGCPSGDCNELALGLVTAINNDVDGLFAAYLIDYTTTPGSHVVVDIDDYEDWVADVANAGKCLGYRLVTIPTAMYKFLNGINLQYDYPRVPTLYVSLTEGFNCNGEIVYTRDAIHSQGDGYDMKKIESDAIGNTATGKSAYRLSGLVGVPIFDYVETVDVNTAYVQYTIESNQSSTNGGIQSTTMTPLSTTVVIPCADTTTRTNFIALMDALTTGKFAAFASTNAACPACDVANVIGS
jgi:hypothetical protein